MLAYFVFRVRDRSKDPRRAPDLQASLQHYLGHVAFRDGQHDLVRTVVDGRDLLAVMAAGSGKSLGFQVPALLLPGVTLVVSPLIALMKVQVEELSAGGMTAATLHSQVDPDDRRQIGLALRNGALRLLSVAPERYAPKTFLGALAYILIARVVVDEAHPLGPRRTTSVRKALTIPALRNPYARKT